MPSGNKDTNTAAAAGAGTETPEVPVLPAVPEYLTGNFVKKYIAACSKETQTRFKQMCALRGITFPETDNVLRTEQVELFMAAI